MPSIAVKRTVAAAPAEVWAVISDIENANRWNTSWSSIEITSNQRHGLGTTFKAHLEDGYTFDFAVVDWANNERIAFAPVRDEGERYSLMLEEHAFTLQEVPEGTLVELKAVASAHGFRGRIYGMFFWSGHQQPGLNEALDAIQDIVEPPQDQAKDHDDRQSED